MFFCGSWAYEGVPLLESAVRSANAVLDAIRAGRELFTATKPYIEES